MPAYSINFYVQIMIIFICLELTPSLILNRTNIHKLMMQKENLQPLNIQELNGPEEKLAFNKQPKHHKRSIDDTRPVALSITGVNSGDLLLRRAPTYLINRETPVWIYSSPGNQIFYRKEYPFREEIPITYEDPDSATAFNVRPATQEKGPVQDDTRENEQQERLTSTERNLNTITWDFNKWPLENIHDIYVNYNNLYAKNYGYQRTNSDKSWGHNWSGDSHVNKRSIDSQWVYPESIGSRKDENMIVYDEPLPKIIYPEVLVVVENSIVQNLQTKTALYEHLLSTWSHIKQVYRPLRDPEYRICLAGFVIADDDNAFDFIKSSSQNLGMPHNLNFRQAINGFGSWLYNQQAIIPRESYDIAILHTSLPAAEIINGQIKQTESHGLSIPHSACRSNTKLKTVDKIGIMYDDVFTDIVAASGAHVLAHILGANHDEGSCFGHNLMSPNLGPNTTNRYQFSPCSIVQLKAFLRTNPACLKNAPLQFQ